MMAERQRAVALRQRVRALNEQRLARASRIAVPPVTSNDLAPAEGWAPSTVALGPGRQRNLHCSGAWALSGACCCAAHDQQRPALVWRCIAVLADVLSIGCYNHGGRGARLQSTAMSVS